ncbi:MAG: LapA family protein [Campylobacteraceae bacterium]|nr:LapA family protein [Campylobacteraceae bacterium]
MRLKHFLVYSIIYIGLVGIIAFVQNASSYTITLLGIDMTLPIALWYILPVAVFALLATLHIICTRLKVYKNKQAVKSDADIYKEYAKEILLGVETDKEFKTDIFQISNDVTKFLSPWHDNSVEIKNGEIAEIISMLEKLNNGEIVDLKKYRLAPNNPLVIENEFNKLEKDSSYAATILKGKTSLDDELSSTAYDVLLENATYSEIKSYPFEITEIEAEILVDRYINDESFEITKSTLLELMMLLDYDKYEFVDLAKDLTNRLEPEVLIALFKKFKDQKEQASHAYLYLLYEYGMMEELQDVLMYSDGEQYYEFEILKYLRDQGKNVSASYFFR